VKKVDYQQCVIVRADGRYFAEHRRVGFLFEVDGRWLKDVKFASKYPRLVAEYVARERGGVAVPVPPK
jgi:hypothetical protein